jgi:RimJ/RimL family protein N-acetyltransferase
MPDTAQRPFLDLPVLTGDVVVLRPLTDPDEPGLAAAAADPAIWAQHSARDRWRPEVFGPYFRFLRERGGTYCIRDRADETIIGCSRYYASDDNPGGIGIGFTFLARSHWGGPTNRDLKRLMLDYAFAHVDRVRFHIAPDNIRSLKATAKLGARDAGQVTANLSGSPSVWATMDIARGDWLRA